MRTRRSSPEHAEAVSRRLATLSAELATVRGDPAPADGVEGAAGADGPAGAAGPVGPTGGTGPGGPDERVPAAAAIPVPGRHARRRATRPRWARSLPIGPAHLAVLALVLAVGLAVSAWLVLRGAAEPAALPTVERAGAPLATAASSQPDETAASAPDPGGVPEEDGAGAGAGVTVDVAGKVRRPGIAVLPAGSRVVDALEAAGGARRGVELASLNLARLLVDGEQLLVGVEPPAGVPSAVAPGAPTPPGTAGALVDLNTADQTTLETLPGVGPVTALAIIEWRDEHGGFTSVQELLEVDGIGDATLEDLAPHVTV